jgi:hypothetical protein
MSAEIKPIAPLGDTIIGAILTQNMMRAVRINHDQTGYVLEWSGNASEQLEAVVSEWLRQNQANKILRSLGHPDEGNQTPSQ